MGPFDRQIKKGQKLAIISPIGGHDDSISDASPHNSNSKSNGLRWEESSGVLRMDLDLIEEGQGQVEPRSKVSFSIPTQPGPGQGCQEAVQDVMPSRSKVGESSMSPEPEPVIPREAFINAPRSPVMESESMVKASGLWAVVRIE